MWYFSLRLRSIELRAIAVGKFYTISHALTEEIEILYKRKSHNFYLSQFPIPGIDEVSGYLQASGVSSYVASYTKSYTKLFLLKQTRIRDRKISPVILKDNY